MAAAIRSDTGEIAHKSWDILASPRILIIDSLSLTRSRTGVTNGSAA
jgi:hypothetical protein